MHSKKVTYCCLEETGRSSAAPKAPKRATPAASKKAEESEPKASAIAPATKGPNACPIPKKSVMKPNAAGASLEPSTSPQAAAMMAGMLHADRPNMIAEIV